MKREKLLFKGMVVLKHKTNSVLNVIIDTTVQDVTHDDKYYYVNKIKHSKEDYTLVTTFKEKENKVMENTVNTTNVTVNNEVVSEEKEALIISHVEIPETIEETLSLIFDTEKINTLATQERKTVETVKYENKEMAVLAEVRDEFISAYKKSLTLANNVEWAQRQVIAQTMNSTVFKSSFINEGDYATQIGVSKSYLSKAKTAVVIYDWLKENGYGTNWKATAVEELISTWNDLTKKSIDFKQFMQFSELKEGMTVSETRQCIKKYKEAMTPKVVAKESVTTTSVPANVVTTTSVPSTIVTTTSVPETVVKPVIPKDFDIETATITEMNISIGYGSVQNGITIDIWLNKEDNKKLISNIERLIKGKLKVEVASLKAGE